MESFMLRFVVGSLVLLAVCWASPAWADWGLSVDLPLSYEFNDVHVVTNSGSPVLWKDALASSIDGFVVTLITPLHLGPVNFGLGYENYTVKGILPLNMNNGNATPQEVDLTVQSKFEIFDLVLDIPTELFNIGLGYGNGSAKTTIMFPDSILTGGQIQIPTVPTAEINQYFVTLGVPIKSFDVHLSWHWVDVQKVTLQNSGNNNGVPQQVLLSGEMVSLGARYNF
jgi:hypothetical protein